jgi:hypothetical protein
MNDEIHGREIVIVDDHPAERFGIAITACLFGRSGNQFLARAHGRHYKPRAMLVPTATACSYHDKLASSASVSLMSAAHRLSFWWSGFFDMGIVITRGWAISHARRICSGVAQ